MTQTLQKTRGKDMKKVNYKEAKRITLKLGMSWLGSDDGTSFYASTEDEDEIFDFVSRKERDEFVEGSNNQ